MDAEIISRMMDCKLLGVQLSVLSVEDNIALKAGLSRGPEVGKHDCEDIAAMMAHNASLDWNYLHRRLERCVPKKAVDLVARLRKMHSNLMIIVLVIKTGWD